MSQRDQLDKAVNTDESRIGSKIRMVGDVELDRISQEVSDTVRILSLVVSPGFRA